MSYLVSTEDLMKVTGYKTAGHLESWLQENHIRYYRGKKGHIFTTIQKLNEALEGHENSNHEIAFGDG